MAPTANPYDELPYGGRAVSETHPDHLAAVARLFGRTPPPVATARVLELGCAEGGNLLPMAAALPGARFVGVDLSERQVDLAERRRDELRLENVTFLALDVADVGETLGTFDYVLAHGLFSWVPLALRDDILRIASRNLSRHGVAYVSYNTYPGWHQRGMVREMLLRGVPDEGDPATRVSRAQELLDTIVRSARDRSAAYTTALAEELEGLLQLPLERVAHDLFEADNNPIHYRDFVLMARAFGLAPLGDARLAAMAMGTLRPDLFELLSAHAGDAQGREQLLDFLRNRRFRQTLLVHPGPDGADPPEEPLPSALDGLLFTTSVVPVSTRPILDPGTVEEFRSPRARLSTSDPNLKAALVALSAATPSALPLEALAPDEDDRDALRAPLLTCIASGIVEPHTVQAPCAREPGIRPEAAPAARLLAAEDGPLPNLWHQHAEVDDLGRLLVTAADGTLEREQLSREVARRIVAGGLLADATGAPVTDLAAVEAFVGARVDSSLEALARRGLLLDRTLLPAAPADEDA